MITASAAGRRARAMRKIVANTAIHRMTPTPPTWLTIAAISEARRRLTRDDPAPEGGVECGGAGQHDIESSIS
jgi:hypothetical protein